MLGVICSKHTGKVFRFMAKTSLMVAMMGGVAEARTMREAVTSVSIHVLNFGGSGSSGNFRMLVDVNGERMGNFVVSPGLKQSGTHYENTPSGTFHPYMLEEMHYSSQSDSSWFYDGDPMPHTIFFKGGFAIHGSYGVVNGQKASHGCIRMLPGDAQEVYEWVSESVRNAGKKSVTITIEDTQ